MAMASSPPAASASLLPSPRPFPPRLHFRRPPTASPSAAASPVPLPRGCRPLAGIRCRAAAGPSPPPSEPPPPSPNDWQESLSRLQDQVRIFFAVLFWMSLFFWGSAWDGTNNSGSNKRRRFGKKSK